MTNDSPISEGEHPARALTCPVCGGMRFEKKKTRTDSNWGFTTHQMTLMICERCQFVMHFYTGQSIFDLE